MKLHKDQYEIGIMLWARERASPGGEAAAAFGRMGW
jgi:hypothetical protein